MLLPFVLALTIAAPTVSPVQATVNEFLARYFKTFPTRATEAGLHDYDRAIEDLSPAAREAWIAFERDVRTRLTTEMAAPDLSLDDRIDGQLLAAEIDRQVHGWTVLRTPERNPLFWTGTLANATVFLLVRDDLPLADRLDRAKARATLIPRLTRQATATLGATDPKLIAPELCRMAAGQARASAEFYRTGFPQAAGHEDASLQAAGTAAADGLAALATFLDGLASRATGDPRLGKDYAETFRLGTGITEPVDQVLARAKRDLEATKREAATYGRSVWAQLMPGETAPADDTALLRKLFDRVEADRDHDLETYAAGWSQNIQQLQQFVRDHHLMTLPDPLTLVVKRSPSYFVGQSVGGVYAAGPYEPEGETILFLPVPPDKATPAEQDAFYRDFNRPFNRMIAAHELIPGHYVQLKYAARQPHKVRALFPDPVYVEGWGTFCEKAMLDEGWGGPLPRLAHLKKQLENISRTIVDIEVHTGGMTRDEVTRFVKDDAVQGDQLARNMWTRALTSSPQLTFYYLGYRQVMDVYDTAKRAGVSLPGFLNGMMKMGPAPLEYYTRMFSGR